MVKVRNDLTGQKINMLTVLTQAEDYIRSDGKHEAQWLCQCDCGSKPKVIRDNNLKNGHTKSCGCLQKQIASNKNSRTNTYELNLIDEHGEYGIGYCNNSGNQFYFDMEDYELIRQYCWTDSIRKSDGYHQIKALVRGTKKDIKMHQLVFGKYCDHIDRNPLNNRKYNLRNASPSENLQNRRIEKHNKSGITGVCWDNRDERWLAYIVIDGKPTILGRYKEKDDAIISRLKAEKEYYKEFASQSNLFEEYKI